MLINIRGTSGSGKTTIVRQIREYYPTVARVMEPDRRQPISYVHNTRIAYPHIKTLGIVGHYEAECGGCDTIASLDKIFSLVKQADDMGMDCIFEGLLISGDLWRVLELHQEGRELLVVALDTPIEVCIESVNTRRLRRFTRKGHPEKYTPVKEKNTVSKHRGVVKTTERLQAEGVNAVWRNRADAYTTIMAALGWTIKDGKAYP
jgi:hypothetical protein